jgi:predicted nucleotidyltransferase
MGRELTVSRLREHMLLEPCKGVRSLAVFGSVARDEARDDSDVDILVEFESAPSFLEFMNLKFHLEELLEARVDLVDRAALREDWRAIVEQEAVVVA